MHLKLPMHDFIKTIALKCLPVSFLRNYYNKAYTKANPSINVVKQLLVDVSAIAKEDAGTGIQRVVRNLYQELLAAPPEGYQIRPIAASRKQGYCYLPKDFLHQPIKNQVSTTFAQGDFEPVKVSDGDLFLGLDLAAHIVPNRITDLLKWKKQGVRIAFVVYDLLPVLEPTWFNPKTTQNFKRWLRTIAIVANDVIAISHTVKNEFSTFMKLSYGLNELDLPCTSIPLGAELINTNQDAVDYKMHLPTQLVNKKFILMVGTLEPRKGHADVLDAIEPLWAENKPALLVIAGKQGWHVEKLMQRIETHIEAGKQLHWINSPSDDVLLALYQNCSGLIMASKGEGFGLPLIEAAYFNKPIMARDIPVFREVAGNAANYFTSSGHNSLINILPHWLLNIEQKNKLPLIFPTWKTSCAQLIKTLFPDVLTIPNEDKKPLMLNVHSHPAQPTAINRPL